MTALEATVLRMCQGGGNPWGLDMAHWGTDGQRRGVIRGTLRRLAAKKLVTAAERPSPSHEPRYDATEAGRKTLDEYDDKHDHYP